MAPSRIVVKRYESDREYQIDANRMLSKGYEVQSVTSEQPRSGGGRILLIGIFAGIFKPKPVLIVTYRLSRQDSSRRQEIPVKQDTKNKIFSDDQNITKW